MAASPQLLGSTIQPTDVRYEASSNSLYIADRGNNAVRKIDFATGVITTVAGNGTCFHSNGVATSSGLCRPFGIALGPSGEVYVTDETNNRVRLLMSGMLSDFAGAGGAGAFSGSGGAKLLARFNAPVGIDVDSATGDVYLAISTTTWCGALR
jgi:DNA-binding beta-propeller fold protein YncE